MIPTAQDSAREPRVRDAAGAGLVGLVAAATVLVGGINPYSYLVWGGAVLLLGLGIIGLILRVPAWSLPALGVPLMMVSLILGFAGEWLWPLYLALAFFLFTRGARVPAPILLLAGGIFSLGLFDGGSSCQAPEAYGGSIFCWERALAVSAVALLPGIGGLALAPKWGVRAGATMIVAETLLFTRVTFPTQNVAGLPFLETAVALALVMPILVSPVWVLLAGSRTSQGWGILLPWGLALVATILIPLLVLGRPLTAVRGPMLWGLEYWLAALLGVVAYSLIWNRYVERSEWKQNQNSLLSSRVRRRSFGSSGMDGPIH